MSRNIAQIFTIARANIWGRFRGRRSNEDRPPQLGLPAWIALLVMSAIERRVVEVVDRLLLEHGELDPVDCLVGFGLLRRANADPPLVAGTEITSALLAPVAQAR